MILLGKFVMSQGERDKWKGDIESVEQEGIEKLRLEFQV